MTDTVKVKKWSYPFKLGSAEATDPQQYYAALAKAKDGYYPLGGNGLWHGGVHFDEATGLVSEHSEVRCIADGQVIAYRIDEAYPVTAYADRQAVASTGFVLVKHQLEVPAPPAPATPAGATPAPTPAGGPTLTFYSLYMHLVDMAGYNATPALARPTYWSGGTFRVKADVTDKIQGLNVRAAAKGSEGYDQILTTLPRGTTVVTGEASTDGKWLKIVSVSPAVSGLAEGTGWVYKNEMTSQGNGQYLIGEQAKDTPAGAAKGLNVRSTAAASGSVISVLPAGTELTISEAGASGKYRKLAQIISGTPMPALTADASGNVPGYVWLPSLEAKSEPKAMGSVVVLDTPVTINAGATIGYAGKYQSHDEGAPRNLVHIEVFSCDDVQAFVTASRSKAAALPADQKNLLHIYKNTNLITHRADISATNPPKVSDPHMVVGYDLIIPVSVLEAMPAEKKIKDTSQSTTAPTLWWHIEGLLGDAQGNPISGWLREQDIMTPRHNPWEWEGFDFIEETGSNADHLAAYLHALDAMTDEEKTTYASNVSASISGPAKSRLYEIIDTDHDNKLTGAEIRAALAKPWFAQSISQLVTKYESEWLYKAEKWDALDALMGHTAAQPNVNWVAEKKRIEGLAWWGDLAGRGGISGDGECWHLHPVGGISNWSQSSQCSCATCGKNIALTSAFMRKIAASSVTDEFIKSFVETANVVFRAYGITTCSQVAHILGQGKAETGRFTKFRESLNYSRQTFTPEHLYGLVTTAINNGFARKGLSLTHAQKLQYIDDHLLGNDAAYGKHSFGSDDYPDNDYRGRGLLHLSFYESYKLCAQAIGIPIDANPTLAETDPKAIVASGSWFWKTNRIGRIADDASLEIDLKIKMVTKKINTGLDQLANRRTYTKEIIAIINSDFGGCAG
ncbi:hypothetical protein PMM47T1_28256 [Pseudomonas sp. M47T1]|uniref:glycoside hydrolase family 19 protein n=1 Tax=Pseudomonas sp. M47T1 TaxID=1179778 RepID=UPI00026086B0|nr:glycoside hydrolase family 19 protein [Pseudomonas sp. M47T1]EIK93160.1 hypothetical protein PMM47T1_28256 [Pseudomonas sp. M47T1]